MRLKNLFLAAIAVSALAGMAHAQVQGTVEATCDGTSTTTDIDNRPTATNSWHGVLRIDRADRRWCFVQYQRCRVRNITQVESDGSVHLMADSGDTGLMIGSFTNLWMHHIYWVHGSPFNMATTAHCSVRPIPGRL